LSAPFAFTWIIEKQLAGANAPRSFDDLRSIREAGIRLIINLREQEHAHADEQLARHELCQLHLPVPDWRAPNLEQTVEAVAAIDRTIADGEGVLVHCAWGVGRTGTLLACYLVATGMRPDTAIARVRELRPGSLEVDEQVDAVSLYELHRRNTLQPPVH
jgi:atypical dual specificity phosphatase